MRITFNPFLVSVAAALLVLVAIVVISHRRNEERVLTAANQPGTTPGPSIPTALAMLALAVLLVPFGIAVAALWGPTPGIVAYSALLAAGVIERGSVRDGRVARSQHHRHDAEHQNALICLHGDRPIGTLAGWTAT